MLVELVEQANDQNANFGKLSKKLDGQRRKIIELQDTQMKYRFIKASGFAPNAVQFLEDAYEEGQTIWRIGRKMSASLTLTSNSLPPSSVSRISRPLERMSRTASNRLRSAIPRRCRC